MACDEDEVERTELVDQAVARINGIIAKDIGAINDTS
jgi:hypothetical protein